MGLQWRGSLSPAYTMLECADSGNCTSFLLCSCRTLCATTLSSESCLPTGQGGRLRLLQQQPPPQRFSSSESGQLPPPSPMHSPECQTRALQQQPRRSLRQWRQMIRRLAGPLSRHRPHATAAHLSGPSLLLRQAEGWLLSHRCRDCSLSASHSRPGCTGRMPGTALRAGSRGACGQWGLRRQHGRRCELLTPDCTTAPSYGQARMTHWLSQIMMDTLSGSGSKEWTGTCCSLSSPRRTATGHRSLSNRPRRLSRLTWLQ